MLENETSEFLEYIRSNLRKAVLEPHRIVKSLPSGRRYTGACYAMHGNNLVYAGAAFHMVGELAEHWPTKVHYRNIAQGFIDDPEIGMTLNRLRFIQQVCRAIDELLDE